MNAACRMQKSQINSSTFYISFIDCLMYVILDWYVACITAANFNNNRTSIKRSQYLQVVSKEIN